MQRYIDFLERYKWLISFIIPFITMLFALSLKDLQIDGQYRIWFEEGSKTLKEYDYFRQEFSNDDGIIVVFRDKEGIFNKKALSTVQRLTEVLGELEYVDRVDSITNYQYVHASKENSDEIEVDDFVGDDLNETTPQYLIERKNIATNDEIVEGSYISKDGTTTMIFARLAPEANEDGDISAKMMAEVKPIIQKESKLTGYKFWLNGGPPITQAFVTIAGHDAMLFTPLVFLVVFVLLYLLFRRISGALIPLGVVLFSFILVLAIQTLLGYKLNNFTANIPVFIIAIGIADAVHIYSVWLAKRQEGAGNKEAVYFSLEKNFLPILLTSLTTIAGFMSLAVSKIVPVATLGIATASGSLLAFLISALWMPSVLLLLKKEIASKQPAKRRIFFGGYGGFIVQNSKKIVAIGTLFALLMGIGLLFVKVDTNTIRYFSPEVEVRKASEFIMDRLTGPMSYTLLVDSGKKDGIKDPVFLRTVEHFYEAYQKRFPKDVRKIRSLLDTIKRYNKILNQKKKIPDSKALVAQYLLLHSMSLPQGMEITDQMDFEERKLRITVQTNIVDTSKDIEMISFAKAWWAKTPYRMILTGQTAMYASMQHDITRTLIYSLTLTIVIVSAMMLLIFKRLKVLWLLLLPNILPIVLVVGLMGWLGLTIDMGVAISGAIIIGVAVDDTIHFLIKYFDARKRGLGMVETFDEVLHYAGRAMLFTTIVLGLAFSIFAFSSFVPNQNFGIITASALAIALMIDLLYLPALLYVADNQKKERNNV